MNERIDELMVQAGARFEFLHGVHYDDFQYKEFAELIVRECVAQIRKQPIGDEVLGGQHFKTVQLGETIATIEEHFGIKE